LGKKSKKKKVKEETGKVNARRDYQGENKLKREKKSLGGRNCAWGEPGTLSKKGNEGTKEQGPEKRTGEVKKNTLPGTLARTSYGRLDGLSRNLAQQKGNSDVHLRPWPRKENKRFVLGKKEHTDQGEAGQSSQGGGVD